MATGASASGVATGASASGVATGASTSGLARIAAAIDADLQVVEGVRRRLEFRFLGITLR